ncbi:MAG: ABC transporter permease [Bacteroidetes bacterium]|nr:ABC transporter permease [Bacteroidota bacterium]
MWFLVITVFVSVLGYWIAPDSTPYSNEQCLEIATKKPGFKVTMLHLRKNEPEVKSNFFERLLKGEKSNFRKIPISKYHIEDANLIVSVFNDFPGERSEELSFSIADILYPINEKVKPQLKNDQVIYEDINGKTHSESLNAMISEVIKSNIVETPFWLGTDRYGRDMLSQLIIGTRVSLSVGFISVFISLIIGVLLGSLAGYFRGFIDDIIMWFINVVWSIPTLLLVIAITFALGKGFWQVFIAVGLTMWVDVARVVRGQILGLREKEFIEAGKALGFKSFRIIFRHLLPNVMGAVIVISAANFASAILLEAGLSFLGIGVQPPMPSWGTMIKEHYNYIILDKAYLAIIPGFAIMLMVLAFMLIGNGLRDALDSKAIK